MSEQENLQIARRVFEAWNAHDANRYAALLDPGHVWETDTLPRTVRGRDAARQTMQMYLGAFPDLHFDIEQMLASGNHVVTRWRATELIGDSSWGSHPRSTSGAPRLHGQRDQERKVRPRLAVLGQRSPTPAARGASESGRIRGDWIVLLCHESSAWPRARSHQRQR